MAHSAGAAALAADVLSPSALCSLVGAAGLLPFTGRDVVVTHPWAKVALI